jgi:hypothetical protein
MTDNNFILEQPNKFYGNPTFSTNLFNNVQITNKGTLYNLAGYTYEGVTYYRDYVPVVLNQDTTSLAPDTIYYIKFLTGILAGQTGLIYKDPEFDNEINILTVNLGIENGDTFNILGPVVISVTDNPLVLNTQENNLTLTNPNILFSIPNLTPTATAVNDNYDVNFGLPISINISAGLKKNDLNASSYYIVVDQTMNITSYFGEAAYLTSNGGILAGYDTCYTKGQLDESLKTGKFYYFDNGYYGTDTFTYTLTDGVNVSNTATVTITIT